MTAPAPLAELLAVLAEEDPRAELTRRGAWLAETLQTTPNRARFDALVEIETGQLFEWDAERRLAALLPDNPVTVARLMLDRDAPGALRDRLVGAITEAGVRIVSWLSPREIRRAIYRIGAPAFRDRVMLGWASANRSATTPQWRLLLIYPETWSPPAFPLGEAEFRAAGVPPGPLAEQVVREVEEWWIDLDFTDDKMAAVERLKAVVQGLLYA